MWSPKQFDMFKKIKEKKSKILDADGMQEILDSNIGWFRYIPNLAFNKITQYPEYSTLNEGLFVQEKKLRINDYVREKSMGIKHLYNHLDDILLDNINWFQAKGIAKKIGGRLMTPAEYFCVKDELERVKGDERTDTMLYDMTLRGEEWLDAAYYTMKVYGSQPGPPKKEYPQMRTHATINQAYYFGGFVRDIPELSFGEFFRNNDIIAGIGVPKTTSFNSGDMILKWEEGTGKNHLKKKMPEGEAFRGHYDHKGYKKRFMTLSHSGMIDYGTTMPGMRMVFRPDPDTGLLPKELEP